MTQPGTPATPAGPAPEATPAADVDNPDTPPPPAEQQPPAPDPEPTPNSEAAKWRVKLRDTETERDALAEQVTGYQRRDCERVVADVLAQPADLWDIAGSDVAEFFNEDGTLNEDAVREAAKALLEQRPGLARDPNSGQPTHHNWGQSSGSIPGGAASWQKVVGPLL